MYNLAIPRIYETVVFNKNNQGKIRYGHGKSTERFSRDGKSCEKRLLRYELTYRHNKQAHSKRSSGRLYPQAGIR